MRRDGGQTLECADQDHVRCTNEAGSRALIHALRKRAHGRTEQALRAGHVASVQEGERPALLTARSYERLAGGKRSGLRAVWKRNRRPDPGADAGDRPDAVVDDLRELRGLPYLAHRV